MHYESLNLTSYMQRLSPPKNVFMHFSCKFRRFTPSLLTQRIPGREEQVEGLEAINTDSIPNANGRRRKKLHCRVDATAQVDVHSQPHIVTHTPGLAHVYVSTQRRGRCRAAEDSPGSYVRDPLGPITVT